MRHNWYIKEISIGTPAAECQPENVGEYFQDLCVYV